MKICTACGGQNVDSAKFCKWCGKPVAGHIKYSSGKSSGTQPEEKKEKKVHRENECPGCGASIFKWDNYCGHCGKKLNPTEKHPVKKSSATGHAGDRKLIIGLVAAMAVFAGVYGFASVRNQNSQYNESDYAEDNTWENDESDYAEDNTWKNDESDYAESDDWNGYDEDAGLDLSDMYNIVSNASDQEIQEWVYDDFDGDGKNEAFIATGYDSDYYTEDGIKSLWFVESDGATTCLIDEGQYWYFDDSLMTFDNCKLLYVSARHGIYEIIGVKNDQPVIVGYPENRGFYWISQDQETGEVTAAGKHEAYPHILEFDYDDMALYDTGEFDDGNENNEEVDFSDSQKSVSYYLAKFKDQDGKWGYMDENGNVIIESQYDDAEDFSETGYAVVGIQSPAEDAILYGKIDIEGNEIIPCKYSAVAEDDLGDFFYISMYDRQNNTIYSGVAKNDGTTYINSEINSIRYAGYDGYFIANLNGSEGVIDDSYNWIVQPQYSSIISITDQNNEFVKVGNDYGLLAVDNSDKTGIIDIQGNVLLPFEYTSVLQPFYKGMFVVENESEYKGVLSLSLDVIHECIYDDIVYSEDNDTALARKDNRFILLYADGSTSTVGEEYFGDYGLYRVYSGDKCGVVDSNGTWIVEPDYDYVVVKKYCIIVSDYDLNENILYDRNGNILSSVYDEYGIFGSEDSETTIIAVQEGNLWGLMDTEGELIIDCMYDELDAESMGYEGINLYDIEDESGVCVDLDGNIISNTYTRYFKDESSDLITAWYGTDWNDSDSEANVKSTILDLNGNVKNELNDFYNVGKFVRVR